MKIYSGQEKGKRDYQEDRYTIIKPNHDTLLAAVFDGHGGSLVSEKLSVEFPFIALDLFHINDPLEYVKSIYRDLNEDTKDEEQGSTMSLVYVTPKEVVLAVLGDSPIQVLTKDGEFVMPKHNVRTNRSEALSAIERGGEIHNGYLYDGHGRHGLQMSRSFGDKDLERVLLRTPQTAILDRNIVTDILIATDGITDQNSRKTPFLLTRFCTERDLLDRVKNGEDNSTVIIIHLGG